MHTILYSLFSVRRQERLTQARKEGGQLLIATSCKGSTAA